MLVVIDKSKLKLEVWKPGPGSARAELVHVCEVALGMEGFRTPSGVYETGPRTHRPDWRAPDWVDPPLIPGTVYKFGDPFNPYRHGLISLHGQSAKGRVRTGYAMHGTTNEASIPGYASHGCARLRKDDILRLLDILPDNTLVVVC